MNILIIGAGYVGLVTGTCLAEIGHQVTCIDQDKSKIALLKAGKLPIYEEGLEAMLQSNMAAGRLSFSANNEEINYMDAEAVFIAVGTPTAKDGQAADLSYLYEAAKSLKGKLKAGTPVVIKSTVPVGTNRAVSDILVDSGVDVISNPEFLREGFAVYDFMNPDRIIVGTNSEQGRVTLGKIYAYFAALGSTILYTSPESAELAKYGANAFLATKIAFINEMADLCEKVGASVADVSYAMGLDKRIGSLFLKAGPGFGGSCFPKDIRALSQTSQLNKVPSKIIEAVINSNVARHHNLANRLIALGGKKIACLGLSFKAGTDDIRESPAIAIIQELLKTGITISCYDPVSMANAKACLSDAVVYAANSYEAASGADVLVVLTEWPEFAELDLAQISSLMIGKTIVDYRNILAKGQVEQHGLVYHSIGI